MSDSILDGTKKILGIGPEHEMFDYDIMTHINSVFATLHQLGIGPSGGFMIEDNSSKWDDYLEGKKNLNAVKTYVYLRVRLLFDPPANSFLVTSLNEQRQELEWRLTEQREEELWILPPVAPPLP